MAQLTTLLMSLLTIFLSTPGVISTTFTILNKCDYTVWPGIQSNAGIASLPTTGFALQKDESKTITAPASWGGRFWGRTHCSQDSTGKFSCVTADCSSGKVECAGNNALPPATLAEFTLNGYGGQGFFDVSLVDGYNLPMLVVPQGGKGQNCSTVGCVSDLNESCPSELKVTSTADGGESVACKSACAALDQDQYCCRGAYGSPNTSNELNPEVILAAQIVLGLLVLIITILLAFPRFQPVKLVLELIFEAVRTLVRIVVLLQQLIRDLHQIISMAHDGFQQVVSILELIVDVVGSFVSLVGLLRRLIGTCRAIWSIYTARKPAAVANDPQIEVPPTDAEELNI